MGPSVDFAHKIVVPQRPAHLVTRRRLLERLMGAARRRLTVISGPAGYGKTSLLLDFAGATDRPVCWYSLDRTDAECYTFLSYLTAAIGQRFPGAMATPGAMLASGAYGASEQVARALARAIVALDDPILLVLDDWHLVEHCAEVAAVVALLLERCPNCHLVLASRTVPHLPDTMLRLARRELSMLDERDLRFSGDEVAAVLWAEYGSGAPAERAAALAEQFNGWIAGVLVAVAAEAAAAARPGVVTAPERQVYQLLAEQVLAQQPPELRQFLLDTALLDELTLESCAVVALVPNPWPLIEQLLRRHLFISELRPGVFRYHGLFRDFLREQYRLNDDAGRRERLARLAGYYSEHGQWAVAVETALAARAFELAAAVIATVGEELYAAGRLETLRQWCEAIPAGSRSATVSLFLARTLLEHGDTHRAQAAIQAAELRMGPSELPAVRLLQAHVARLAGRYEQALALVDAILAGPHDQRQQAGALRVKGIAHYRLGQVDQAVEALERGLELMIACGDLCGGAQIRRDLGICSSARGDLAQAESYYDQAEAYWVSVGNSGHRAMILNSRGCIQRQRGRYAEAHQTLTVALGLAREASMPGYVATILSCLGDLYGELGRWELAAAAYEEAERSGCSAHVLGEIQVARIQLLVRRGEHGSALRELRRLAPELRRRSGPLVRYLEGSAACAAGELEAARAALAELEAAALAHEAPLTTARRQLLAAQIAWAAGDAPRLVEALRACATLLTERGLEHCFCVETHHMPALLEAAVAAGWAGGRAWARRHQDLAVAAAALAGPATPRVLVRALGAEQLLVDDEPVALGWAKAREVLYFLLTHPDGATGEQICEAIWPDTPVARSRDTLRAAIYQLRSTLPRPLIALAGRQRYRLDRAAVEVVYDVERFEELVGAGDDEAALAAAVELYGGALLPATESTWCAAPRARLERAYLHALTRLAAHAEGAGRIDRALDLYERVLAVDPLDESAHAGVMRCHLERGNRGAAIFQYQGLRRLLDEELGLEPDEGSPVERLYRAIIVGGPARAAQSRGA